VQERLWYREHISPMFSHTRQWVAVALLGGGQRCSANSEAASGNGADHRSNCTEAEGVA
jgi:hypothetical protein